MTPNYAEKALTSDLSKMNYSDKESTNDVDDPSETRGLTIFQAALSFLSGIIGGGIVGLPYSMYHAGIPMGLILNLLFGFLTIYSAILYLEAKDMVGNYK